MIERFQCLKMIIKKKNNKTKRYYNNYLSEFINN